MISFYIVRKRKLAFVSRQKMERKMMEVSIRVLKERQDTVRSNWGFVFALLCAVLWGTCYQGIGFLQQGEIFGATPFVGADPFASSFFIAACLSLFIFVVLFIWLIPNGQTTEWLRFITSFGKRNLLCLIGAFCGGVAAWSTYVIAASVDTTFSVIMVMFYPAVGMLMSKKLLNEKVARNYYIGLGVIVLGWIALYLPDLVFSSLTDHIPIYIIGAIAGIGWGIEGAIATKVMETVDVNVVVATRYAYEFVLWIVAAFFLSILIPGFFDELGFYVTSVSTIHGVTLVIIACCLAFNYLCWHKSFLLCGVSKGLAVSDVSGFVTVIVGMLLLTSFPDWTAVFACILMAVGVFIIYNSDSSAGAILRDVDRSIVPPLINGTFEKEMSDKQAALQTVAARGALWDYEVVKHLCEKAGLGATQTRRKKQIRVYLIEATAMGIVVPVDHAIDPGDYFGKGKLLTQYALTRYGQSRIGVLPAEEVHDGDDRFAALD